VIANGDITGDVIAAGDARADALKSISGDVTAHGGSAIVSALADYYGTVTAEKDAIMTVGGSISQTEITAGRDAYVSAHDVITLLNVTADRDLRVLSDTTIDTSRFTAGVQTGGSVTLGALQAISEVEVEAGLHASIFCQRGHRRPDCEHPHRRHRRYGAGRSARHIDLRARRLAGGLWPDPRYHD
jgi:hypothetical protein